MKSINRSSIKLSQQRNNTNTFINYNENEELIDILVGKSKAMIDEVSIIIGDKYNR